MPKIYLAGADGSPESRAAVEFARRLARSEGATVVSVHVSDDSPARGLHEQAQELGAKLIVVGATHRGPFGRLASGSVGMHLLHGAPCRVLVVRGGGLESPLRTIGVAFDDRDDARAALHAAREVAERLGAEIVVIGALQTMAVPVAIGSPGMPDVAAESRQQFESKLERAAESVGGSYLLLTGPAGRTIAGVSSDFDMLVTGSRGYGAAGSVLLGSVSRHLVDHAHCPVLVVPRPA